MTDEKSGAKRDWVPDDITTDDLPDFPAEVTRYVDQEGNQLTKNPKFQGTLEEFAAMVARLNPWECAWPNGGRLSQKGIPCRAPKFEGTDACIHHAGPKMQRRGTKDPGYRGKKTRFERTLPPEVARMVMVARNDPDLLSVRQDVALLDARRAILAGRLYTGESGSLWASLNRHWMDLGEANRNAREARDAEDDAKAEKFRQQAQEAITAIGRVIQQGHKDETAWKELVGTTRDLVELKGKEHIRLEKLSQMIYAEDVMNMLSTLLATVMENVKDGVARQTIAEKFSEIVNPGNRRIAARSPVGAEAELLRIEQSEEMQDGG